MIEINPCGRFVDFIRRTYKTNFLFWPDDPTAMEVTWYPCLPTAPDLGVPTPYMSRRWDSEQWLNADVGEDFNAPQPFVHVGQKAAGTGEHRCGSDQQWGGNWTQPPLPTVTYNADGLPTCCSGLWGVGGIGWSGTAKVVARHKYRTYYGVGWSGTAHSVVAPITLTSGGVGWSGTAVSIVEPALPTSGGVGWSGTAVSVVEPALPTSGGVGWSGTAAVCVVGADCECAIPLVQGVSTPGSFPPGPPRWYSFVVDLTQATWTFTYTQGVPFSGSVDVSEGMCPPPNFVSTSNNSYTFTIPTSFHGPLMKVKVVGSPGATYTIKWDQP